jgi:hypothetical protein
MLLVNSYAPKFRPVTVTDMPPVVGTFVVESDSTAVSNEKTEDPVPATALSVRCAYGKICLAAPTRHLTVVRVDHDAVAQLPKAITAVAVYSDEPKPNPRMVNVFVPVRGIFRSPAEPTGASNVKSVTDVPATAATVTCATKSLPLPPELRQVRPVLDSHANVLHATELICVVCVRSDTAKFNPATVTLGESELGKFNTVAPEVTGLSKVNCECNVPTTAPTVT